MTKADEKVVYDDVDGKKCEEQYTHFEVLQKKVELLKDCLDEVVAILKANNLTRKEIIEAKYFDDEELYNALEEAD